MLDHAQALAHASISPGRAASRLGRQTPSAPLNPMATRFPARAGAAAPRMFAGVAARPGKPEFGIVSARAEGLGGPENDRTAPLIQRATASLPIRDRLHFRRDRPLAEAGREPPPLIVAHRVGHFATLLRNTVAARPPARGLPRSADPFVMDDVTETPVRRQTAPNRDGDAAGARPAAPPFSQAGVPARVVAAMTGSLVDMVKSDPRFLQPVYRRFVPRSDFMRMSLDRNPDARMDHFRAPIRGDGEMARRRLHDAHLSAMDLTAEFRLRPLDPALRRRLPGAGGHLHRDERRARTEAAHGPRPALPSPRRARQVSEDRWHSGMFNGARRRSRAATQVRAVIRAQRTPAPACRTPAP